ncbi:FmdB family zinc ribbon protein [Tepidiforma sp.]|uniref:FmdB family zinc ribbon protein n=1 Tax=Tepidiforma sp. TaxID=2682230 RepID=UPI002ADE745E|nr:FmdB family zinc ribbon protein [Tepidiforma sp.]
MAIYEFYCPTCREKFEERRSMASASAPASCPRGHRAERVLSMFAAPRGAAASEAAGGCCSGGACACSSAR